MPPRAYGNPGFGYGGPRYAGTFLLALREALTELNWQAVTWKPALVECLDGEGRSQVIGFDNLYRRLRREPRENWTEMLVGLLGSVPAEASTPPARLDDAAGQLLVRLGTPYKPENPDTDVWCLPLVKDLLVATLVIDYPTSMSYVTARMILDSGKSGTVWLERALDNLRAKSQPGGMQQVHEESGLLQGQFGDAYDSSRALLLDELLPGQDEDGFYVVVPSRDHLLVLPVTSQTINMAPWLRAIAVKTNQDMPYPISPELFWVRRGVWHLFGIEAAGENMYLTPPPEFAEVIDRLKPDIEDADEDMPSL